MTFRSASEGYWIIFLIPLAIFLQDEHRMYKPILMIVMFNSVIISLFHVLKLDFGSLLPNLQKTNLFLALCTLLFCIERGGSPYLFFSYTLVNYAFPFLFVTLVKMFPKSFTFGEAILICQAFFISFWAATLTMMKIGEVNDVSDTMIAVFVAHAGFLACLVICRAILFSMRPWTFTMLDLAYCGWIVGVVGVFIIQCTAPQFFHIYDWVLGLLTEATRIKLLVSWLVLTVASIGFVAWKNWISSIVTTSDRKYFHFIILLVFVPGVLVDYGVVFIASVAATCAFILLEVMRVLRFRICHVPVGDVIENCVSVFRDKQDEGITILTPIYLLAGCSVPVWLNLVNPNAEIGDMNEVETAAAFSGVLSIAVGDTFASIGGSIFGRHKWKGSNKTVEGTGFSIAAQFIFIFLMWYYGFGAFSWTTLTSLVVAAVINALVEAATDQIDNLVLPLLTYNIIVGTQRALVSYASRQRGIFF